MNHINGELCDEVGIVPERLMEEEDHFGHKMIDGGNYYRVWDGELVRKDEIIRYMIENKDDVIEELWGHPREWHP